jgi:DNA-binding MarR family transcriptional regulator
VRNMEKDGLIARSIYGGNARYIQYSLTDKGKLLLPLLDSLRRLGLALDCNECKDRLERLGAYCDWCPHNENRSSLEPPPLESPGAPARRHQDDSIVLL